MACHLRLATPDDAAAAAAIYAPYVRDTVISFEAEPPDAAEFGRRIAAVTARYPWLVAVRGGAVAGYAYAAEHRSRAAYRWDVDVGIYLDATVHRRGIGRRLYLALFELLRAQGLVNAYAGITLPNAASVGLHESMGFAAAGHYPKTGYKSGAWHDVGWWGLVLREPASAPTEPLPFPEVSRKWVADILARHSIDP